MAALENDFKVKHGLVVTSTATVLSTVNATNTVTGALRVAGGQSIGKDLWVHGQIYAGNFQVVTTATTVTNTAETLQTVTDRGNSTTVSTFFNAPDTTHNTTTGAVRVLGGIGVGGSVFVGGQLTATTAVTVSSGANGLTFRELSGGSYGAVYSTNITPSASNYTLATDGAATNLNALTGIYANINNANKLSITGTKVAITPTTVATSTSTGALTVEGGVGIGGALYVQDLIYSQGNEVLTTASIITAAETLASVTARGNVTTASIYAAEIYSNNDRVITTASIITQTGLDKSVDTTANTVTLAFIPGQQGLSTDWGLVSDPTGPITYEFGTL